MCSTSRPDSSAIASSATFDEDHPQLTASAAAERAGITRTAARRYLLSLVHVGYALSDGKQFWLAPRVLRLGQSYLGTAKLPRLVQPFIQRVAQQIGHTVNASVLDGHEVVYIARSSPPRWVTIGYGVGVRIPAHVVTPGFVVLSAFDDEALDVWIRRTSSFRTRRTPPSTAPPFAHRSGRRARSVTGTPSSSWTPACAAWPWR